MSLLSNRLATPVYNFLAIGHFFLEILYVCLRDRKTLFKSAIAPKCFLSDCKHALSCFRFCNPFGFLFIGVLFDLLDFLLFQGFSNFLSPIFQMERFLIIDTSADIVWKLQFVSISTNRLHSSLEVSFSGLFSQKKSPRL